ncbi:MAG: divalent-cation tolerance protein CutA [Thermoproteota archaeon]|nr:divalent-cation tolerance protein CutA [Thermoproteota archaeon]
MAKSDLNGIILISTFSSEESLVSLAKNVVMEKKICACVSYTKVNSIYMWNSNLQQEKEFIAFFKTTSSCVEELKKEIEYNHPYEIPEIVIIKMNDVSSKYLSWMLSNTIQ